METSLFEYIPLAEEVTDPQVVIVLRAMYKALERLPFVRGARSEWLRPSEACLSPSELQSLFSPTEFSGRRSKRLRYAAPGLASRSWRVLRALGASQFDTEEMVGILQTSRILSSKSLPDLLRTYAFLARRLASDGPTEKALVTRLGSSAFLRTYEGRWESPEQAMRAGRIIAYPAKLTKAELARLPGRDLLIVLDPFLELSSVRRRKVDDKLERQRAQVKEFFEKSFGIRRSLTVSQIVFDLVVPKLSDPGTPDRVADQLLAFVRAHLARFVKEAQKGDRTKTEERILAELGKRLPIAAENAGGGKDRRPLVSIYLRAGAAQESVDDLFTGVDSVWFVSGRYLRQRVSKGEPAWPTFFRKLGAWSSPRMEFKSGPIPMGNGEYAWIERGYSPKHVHQLSFDVASPDLEALFEHCRTLPQDDAVSRFALLWDTVAANWTSRYQDSVFCEYWYYYYGNRYRSTVPTTLLQLLRSQAWVLGSDGTLHAPVELTEDTPENRAVIAEGAVYAAWKAPKTMLESLGIHRSPRTEAIIARLKLLKEREDPGTNLLQVVLPAYRFLQADSRAAPEKRADLAKQFEQWELLYTPRADKSWWPPSLCYLSDFESTFGPLRAYLDRYPRDVLEFFEALGARSAPDFAGCLSAVDQLQALGEQGDATARQTLPGICKHMARLIALQTPEPMTRPVAFLAEDGQWRPSSELYFSDDSRLRAVFPGLPYLYAPVTLQTIAPLLDFLGVHVLSSRVQIEKRILGNRPIPADGVERIRWACTAVMRELHRRVTPGPLATKWAHISQTLEVESASMLKVRYILKHRGTRQTRTDQPSRFYSSSENRLYVRQDGSAFDIASAVELARMFEIFADDARSILSALLPQARTEESLFEALDRLGVGPTAAPVAPPTIQYLPPQARTETGLPGTTNQTAVATAGSAPSVSAPPVPEAVPPLKDPGRLVVGESIQHSPYQPEEGTAGEERTIIRRTPTGLPKPVVVRYDTAPTVQAAERTGHEIVEMVERTAGRKPIPVAGERKIGYDYESSGRKIEVKGHQADSPPSTITLTEYERKAAEEEGDSYWVYVVTGLRQGTATKVYMIQNPLKYLAPKLPSTVELENWKAAVREEYVVREKDDGQTEKSVTER